MLNVRKKGNAFSLTRIKFEAIWINNMFCCIDHDANTSRALVNTYPVKLACCQANVLLYVECLILINPSQYYDIFMNNDCCPLQRYICGNHKINLPWRYHITFCTICTNQALSSRWQIVKTCKVWLTLSKTRSGLPVCGFACFDGLIMSILTWLCKRKYLKGYSTPKQTFCHKSLTPSCRSKPIKALFVFGTQFKIFWMKTAVCDCPIDCQVNDTNVIAQKSMKSIARIVHLTSVVQSEFN